MIHPLLADRRGLVLYIAVWLLLGVALALPAVGLESGRWHLALLVFLPPFMIFSSLCLTAWYPCRANPLESTSSQRLIAVHLSAGLVSSLAWYTIARLWAAWLADRAAWPASIELRPARYLALGVLFYLLAATLHYLMLAYEESRRAQASELELEVLAREAELAAFKSQIDPHFLFNCLNSISSLCGSRPADARRMTIRLGEFLRSSLRLADRDFISLGEEIELARGYLDIERTRFGARLAIVFDTEDASEEFQVPSLLLQPLLENSIKHGIADLVDGGTVTISARPSGERLRIEVANPIDPDGSAEEGLSSAGEGIGLKNVVGRLEVLYHGDAHLEIHRGNESFRVTIDLPERARSTRSSR